MTQTTSNHSRIPLPRFVATFISYADETFCTDKFEARNMGQAQAFAVKRAPACAGAISLEGPGDEGRYLLLLKQKNFPVRRLTAVTRV